MRRVDISGEITAMPDNRIVSLKAGGTATVCDATFSDGSSNIKLSLWDDDIKKCKVGDRVRVENGYTNSYRGEVKLNIGRFGKLAFL